MLSTLEGQKIADVFASLKFIPKPLKVSDAAWKVGVSVTPDRDRLLFFGARKGGRVGGLRLAPSRRF